MWVCVEIRCGTVLHSVLRPGHRLPQNNQLSYKTATRGYDGYNIYANFEGADENMWSSAV